MNDNFEIHYQDNQILLDLNMFIHSNTKLGEYHIKHLDLLKRYAIEILRKLSINFNVKKIETIALAHDLFKERSLNKDVESVVWNGIEIPHNLNRYIRMNLDVLEEYGLVDYFNTDIQLHPQAAMIFMIKEFGITSKDVLYPIVFHSCPIISVYETLDCETRVIIDIIMLCDKLSSNYLKINQRGIKVEMDLDKIIFGPSGLEFNYTMGLYLARLIGQGSSKEKHSLITTNHYYKRLCEINPLISGKNPLTKLGGKTAWPKRESLLWKTQ